MDWIWNIGRLKGIIILNLIVVQTAFTQTYFQQQVNYKIKVRLDDIKNTLHAFEELEYINNSPDVLNEIWIHLWPNAYKNNTSALVKQQVEDGNLKLYFATEDERGFIDSLDFKVDGKSVALEYKEVDYGKIKLLQPLMPGQKIIISTPFVVKIPDAKFSRLGHDQQAYYISQWYPKPAVYDAKGWHPMPYLDQGEFYSEFGTFVVTIELPKNYVVGATGELGDNNAEYEWLTKKADETAKIEVFEKDMSFPVSDEQTKTLTYHQTDVHDFAWFADKRWHVLKGEITLPHTKRKVTTWTMFTNDKASWWKKSIDYVNRALYDYSLWNGDYLYNSCTAVDGVISAGTGMEYPMITIVGGESDSLLLDATIAHEVGHNWFYGMLGSNERDHPWMDEGVNSFNEMRYMLTEYPASEYGNRNELMMTGKRMSSWLGLDNLDYKEAWQLEYNTAATIHADQPIEGISTRFTPSNYGIIVYRKTGIALQYLRQYLGDTLFDHCMQQYFDTWKLRHPYPENFKEAFVAGSGKNLDWFFNDMMTTTKTVDYRISGIKHSGSTYILSVCNKSGFNAPFQLNGLLHDSLITTIKNDGFAQRQQINIQCEDCDAFEIDHFRDMPDVNRSDNSIRAKGMFKKVEPLSIHLLPQFESARKTNLCLLPSVAANEYNKLMAGITFYDKFIPVKQFEYALSVLYGFGDRQLAGCGSLNYNIYNRNGFFDYIGISVSGKRFAYLNAVTRKDADTYEKVNLHYSRIEPAVEFSVRNKDARSNLNNSFGCSLITFFSENTILKQRVILNDSMSYNVTGVKNNIYNTFRLYFQQKNTRTLDPYSYKFQFEGNNDYGKLSMTANFKFNYRKTRRGMECRVFAGSYIYNDDKAAVQYPYSLSGWDGSRDYWADEYYFGRSESTGILSQQMSVNDGGFKTDIPYARVTSWITALNLRADFPGRLPLKAFFDIGTFKDAKNHIDIYNDNVLLDGGICLSLMNGAMECYVPLIKSKGIKKYTDDQGLKFGEQIRFVVNLNLLNPLYLRKQIIR